MSSIRLSLLTVIVLTIAACHSLRPVTSSPSKTNKSPIEHTSALRQDIAKYAAKQEGAKYKYGAKGPRQFDCSGLTCYIYKAHDIDLPPGSYNQARLGMKIKIEKAQPGDLVFFGRGTKVNHVALILKNTGAGLEVIHSTSSRGVIKENVSRSSYWKPRILYVRNVLESNSRHSSWKHTPSRDV